MESLNYHYHATGQRLAGKSMAEVTQEASTKWEAMAAGATPTPALPVQMAMGASWPHLPVPPPLDMQAGPPPGNIPQAIAAMPMAPSIAQAMATAAIHPIPLRVAAPIVAIGNVTIERAPDGRPFLSTPAGTRYLKRKSSGGADDYRVQTCPDGRPFLRSPSAGKQAWVDDVLDGSPGSWPQVTATASGSSGHVALVEHDGRGFALNLGMVAALVTPATPASMAMAIPLRPWDPSCAVPGVVQGVASPGWPMAMPHVPGAPAGGAAISPAAPMSGHAKLLALVGPHAAMGVAAVVGGGGMARPEVVVAVAAEAVAAEAVEPVAMVPVAMALEEAAAEEVAVAEDGEEAEEAGEVEAEE